MNFKNMASERKLTQKIKSLLFHLHEILKQVKVTCLVTQWCPSLWDLLDRSPPGSSVHGILQACILEQVAIPFFRVSFWPRIESVSPCLLRCRWILPESPKPEVTYGRKKSEVLQGARARAECADLQLFFGVIWLSQMYTFCQKSNLMLYEIHYLWFHFM